MRPSEQTDTPNDESVNARKRLNDQRERGQMTRERGPITSQLGQMMKKAK